MKAINTPMNIYDDLANLIECNLEKLASRVAKALMDSNIEPFTSSGFVKTFESASMRLDLVAKCLRNEDVLLIQRHAREDAYGLLKRGFGYNAFISLVSQLYIQSQHLVEQEINDPILAKRYIARLQRMKLLVETTITSVKFRNFSEMAV